MTKEEFRAEMRRQKAAARKRYSRFGIPRYTEAGWQALKERNGYAHRGLEKGGKA